MRYLGNTQVKLVLLVLLVGMLSLPAVAHGSTHSSTSNVTEQLRQLNLLNGYTYQKWQTSYTSLRKNPTYNWMDWSQDGCSGINPIGYHSKFHHGCLRHDLSWRTLPIIDAATGRIWNERNRYIADSQFKTDAFAYCDEAYPLRARTVPGTTGHTACITAATTYYGAVRYIAGFRSGLSAAETTSTTGQTTFIEFPAASTTTTVDCRVTTNRCLPINYLELDGKPFAPQNIERLPVGLPVKLQVVRANHQSVGGAPSQTLGRGSQTGTIGNTGELLLRAKFPLRAATTSNVVCPTTDADADDPDDSEVYASINGYPLVTLDNTLKKTTVYVKVCQPINGSETSSELLELLPVRAVYSQSLEPPPADPPHTWQTSISGRVRHYENLRAGPSGCNPTAITLSSAYRSGAWASSDCSSILRPGKYADYYTFTLTEAKRMQIDLKSSTDPYLFLVHGSVVSANSQINRNDDFGGSLNSRIAETLQPGDYTIVATTFSGRAGRNVGSYQLRVKGETVSSACTPTAVSLSATARSGAWTAQDCQSSRRPTQRAGGPYYVDYYTFTLASRTTVQIDLMSRTDTYLYLIDGTSSSGTRYRLYDDDGGSGYNSRISSTLPAGSYTVAAATYYDNAVGTYTLRINR